MDDKMLIDLTECPVDIYRTYDGANGAKKAIIYNGERYMVKFPAHAKNNPDMTYSNGCINEYIASNIFRSLGIDTQETFLGRYRVNDEYKLVVACKDFCNRGEKVASFATIKNTVVDSESNGFGTEIEEVLDAIRTQQIYDPIVIEERFWDMFVADALLGNFDRHNGNWGFIVDEINQNIKLAPVFDNASCLYPQLTDAQMKDILSDQQEIDKRIYVFPNSALKVDGKKINYLEYLSDTNEPLAISALEKISARIDHGEIADIIINAAISDTKKDFYIRMIKERETKIIKKALEKQRISIPEPEANKTYKRKKTR